MTEGIYKQLLDDYVTNSDIATAYDEDFKANQLFETDTAFLDQELTQPCNLLDVGCGTGRHMIHFAKKHFSVTGVDMSKPMLNVAKRKIVKEGLICKLVDGDIRKVHLPDSFFSAAICMFSVLGLIGPMDERVNALKRIHKTLHNNGKLIFHVHNLWHSLTYLKGWRWVAKSWFMDLLGRCEFGDKYVHQYRSIDYLFIHTFTKHQLQQMLQSSGFVLKRIQYLNEERTGFHHGLAKSIFGNGMFVVAEKLG